MMIRPAIRTDAPKISEMLEQIVAAGKRTAPSDPDHVASYYLTSPERIECSIAVDDDGTVLGLQSLSLAVEGNRFDTPIGWGIIGTHVSPLAARRGIGKRLFQATTLAAHEAGITDIEAFIGASNAEGQAYYEAIGFRTCRTTDTAICKRYRVSH